jgi:hypothetical protein
MGCTPHCILQSDTVYCGSGLGSVEMADNMENKNGMGLNISVIEALVYLATDK